MKNIKKILLLIILMISFSCTEDNIAIEDSFLNYDIPIVSVTSDYIVGAQYSRFIRRSTVPEEPTIGVYNPNVSDPAVYEEHVKQAQIAGIDFFIFQFRSANNQNQNNQKRRLAKHLV